MNIPVFRRLQFSHYFWTVVGVAYLAWLVHTFSRPKEVFDPEARIREIQAEVIREKAECQADAVEFGGDSEVYKICVQGLRLTVSTARDDIARLRSPPKKVDVAEDASP